MKKILALILAAMMLLGMVSALADTATGNVTNDPVLTIKGLEKGDEVTLYKVLNWTSSVGWTPAAGFEDLTKSGEDNYSANIASIVANTAAELLEADVQKITALAAAATAIGPYTTDGTTFTYGEDEDPAAAGLYLALVAAKTAGVIYNPIIVASDFTRDNDSDSIDAATANLIRSIEPSVAVAKKETITVLKVADDITHDYGDPVHFTITTTVPLYSSSYTNPWFKVTDTLSENLELDAASIHVYATDDPEKAELVDDTTVTKKTADIGDADFQITFTKDYLETMIAALPITIEYDAEFTNEGGVNVVLEDNTVDVTYSNNPSDEDDYGTLRDETKHYSFTIDGTLLGNNDYHNSEIVKIGLDAEGNEILQETELDNGSWIGALEGATFALFTSEPTKAETADETAAKASEKIYKNDHYSDGAILTSNATGHIEIKGLDADNNEGEGTTYYLAELTAPAGYVKDSNVYRITIIPTFTDVDYTDETLGCSWTVKELQSYVVKVNGVITASYTFEDAEGNATTFSGEGIVATEGDNVIGATGPIIHNDGEEAETNPAQKKEDSDGYGKIQNTQGVALPSTGGIGTTLFYVGGGILILLAVVLLVTKRRMNGND